MLPAAAKLWVKSQLVPPLTIGKTPLVERTLAGSVDANRTGGQLPEGAIVGQQASPGRATWPVEIVRGTEDFDRFQPGEVLVARATAPAWIPLFGRAAAVVTDGGTLAAHASLVAWEYGIPAVVGTGDARIRLSGGQVVIADSVSATQESRRSNERSWWQLNWHRPSRPPGWRTW